MVANTIKTIVRYLKLYLKLARFNLIYITTYRVSFLIEMCVELFYFIALIVLFNVLYGNIKSIVGWSYYEMLFLIGIETIMSELFVGLVFANNTNDLPNKIRTGMVDFALLKPLSSLFSLTISTPYLPSLLSIIPGFYLLYLSLNHLHIKLGALNVLGGLLLLGAGFIIGYSVMVIITSLSFIFINANAIPRLGMNTIINFTTRPHQIFKGIILKTIFYLVVPVVFVVSIPTSVFIRSFSTLYVLSGIILAIIFLNIAKIVWSHMIGYYSSASS